MAARYRHGRSPKNLAADRPHGKRQIAHHKPGRTQTIELWPLSQGEIDSAADGFVDAIFRLDGSVRMPPSPMTKRDYVVRALRGGYPDGPGDVACHQHGDRLAECC